MDDKSMKADGLIISYYLSRLDKDALKELGYASFTEAFKEIGKTIGENPNNIKNMRDEFDPYFPNPRAGWYQRPLRSSRKEVFDKFSEVSDQKLTEYVKSIISKYKGDAFMNRQDILLDLGALIRQSTVHYSQEFIWQDVSLNNEFKEAYEEYLGKTNASVEFFDATSVITTSTSKYIFVPNQWFVIASYAVGVFNELSRYKERFIRVTEREGKRPDEFAKHLRDDASVTDKTIFLSTGKEILQDDHNDSQKVEKAAGRLWRFVTDYSWWSGQKTVDRGDFYYSVVLNMLNLVNASQGYVADIVNAYGSNQHLMTLTRDLSLFTNNLSGTTYDFDIQEEQPEFVAEKTASYGGEKHKITISSSSINKLNGGR